LSQHLRAKKARGRSKDSDVSGSLGLNELTREGYAHLQEELQSLKDQRAPIASEISKAAADKDVRENAPLEAAREQLGLVESRVRVIEDTLRHSVIVDFSKTSGKEVSLGSKVKVKDLSTGKESVYTLVGATEAKPLDGRISNVSPVGKALIKRSAGQEVDVETPRGKLRYRVVRVTS
jgi:transcription elongation factor GreA